jgi:hypothetical protein
VFGFLFISVWHIGRFAINGPDRRVADDQWVGSSTVPVSLESALMFYFSELTCV